MSTPLRARPIVVDDWFHRLSPRPEAAVRVFCFPHAGGDVTAFAPVAEMLDPRAEVWALRLPGRGGRFADPLPSRFTELVAAVAAATSRHRDRPAVFYGQSFGALLAFEVARVLPPDALVPAAALPPDRWAATVPADSSDLLRDTGADQVVPDLLPLVRAVTDADIRLCRDYRHTPGGLGIPVHAVAGSGDPVIRPADMADWAARTTGPFHLSVVDGGHLVATTAPAELGAVLDAITHSLVEPSEVR